MVIAMAALLLPVLADAESDKGTSKCEACIETARLMRSSSLNEAVADYYVGLAKANNELTASQRAAAKKQAADEYKVARDLARNNCASVENSAKNSMNAATIQ